MFFNGGFEVVDQLQGNLICFVQVHAVREGGFKCVMHGKLLVFERLCDVSFFFGPLVFLQAFFRKCNVMHLNLIPLALLLDGRLMPLYTSGMFTLAKCFPQPFTHIALAISPLSATFYFLLKCGEVPPLFALTTKFCISLFSSFLLCPKKCSA